jgi:hypothetical protein
MQRRSDEEAKKRSMNDNDIMMTTARRGVGWAIGNEIMGSTVSAHISYSVFSISKYLAISIRMNCINT